MQRTGGKNGQTGSTTLRRGDRTPVSNLLSAFGALKETHVSAMLGYLIHLNPGVAQKLFGIEGPLDAVSLEPRSDDGEDRYDIVLHDGRGEHVIEVKIAGHQPNQITRYGRKKSHLYAIGSRLRPHLVQDLKSECFRDWQQVAEALVRSKSRGHNLDQYFNRLVDDFLIHLKESHMVQGHFSDVYVRDLSGDSVEIYFNQWIYKCQPKFFEGAKNARYFAPYLTGSNTYGDRQSVFRSLGVGISFISKVKSMFLASEKDTVDLLKESGYDRRRIDAIYEAFRWRKTSPREHAVMVLEAPMRLFQRPITKYDLWKVPGGAMPPMSMDFGDLLAAANGLYPLQREKGRKAA